MRLSTLCGLLVCLSLVAVPALAQEPPVVQPIPEDVPTSSVVIASIEVTGTDDEGTQSFVRQASGLTVGESIDLPLDPSVAEAIRNVYNLGLFSDVRIVERERTDEGAHLVIEVRPEPRLTDFSISGIPNRRANELKEKLPLLRGTPVRPGDLDRSVQIIEEYYEDRGNLLVDVNVAREIGPNNTVELVFNVDPGPRVTVGQIVVDGNEAFSDGRIRGQMKDTRERRWWRFWSRETVSEADLEEDIQRVLDFYNQRGFYDAQVLRDSIGLRNGDRPEAVVYLEVREGPRYHVRNIDWEGNTVYSDSYLSQLLGFERGDVFDKRRFEQNLYANRQSSDVASHYMNRGYMRFNLQPHIRVVPGDSVDITIEVIEGEVYEFGDINIAGNRKTNEHVIRRELYTVPGQVFSRDAIQESIRRLSQLNYFTQESLMAGPSVDIDDARRVVDLTYRVEEAGSDQLELSGTWGRFGLILMLRFSFNNFSTSQMFDADGWRPIPTGDGQRLSLGVQTNGTFYQSYSLSFTEPWFRGRPTPVGFSLSYSRYGSGGSQYFYGPMMGPGFDMSLETAAASVFMERRLRWPDDRFSTATTLRYQYYNYQVPEEEDTRSQLPRGVSQVVAVEQSLTRSSLDHPMFPTSGSFARASVEVSPPISNFIQYHKWRLRTNWNMPLSRSVSLGVGADYGYLGSLTGERVDFDRFVVGGSPFDTQGFQANFGQDFIYMRGYPATAIGPRWRGDPVGGTILNKYTSELRWMAVQSPQLSLAPYLFLDAANTWDNFQAYNPSQLYRSAGVGARLFLPIIGMIELVYGYNFDEFAPVNRSQHEGTNRWFFQFTLGQGFN
jgi:outer membrane protein insertion porin family